MGKRQRDYLKYRLLREKFLLFSEGMSGVFTDFSKKHKHVVRFRPNAGQTQTYSVF